jgi:hypothetical protein
MCFRGAWANGYMVIAKSLRRSVISSLDLNRLVSWIFYNGTVKKKIFSDETRVSFKILI